MTPSARYIASHFAAKLCRACPQPAAPGRSHCTAHLAANRERFARIAAARDAANLCRRCGLDPREADGRWCATCRRVERIKEAA